MANEKLIMELDQEIKNYKTLCELLASMTSYKEIPDKDVNRMALDSCEGVDKFVRKWTGEYMNDFRKRFLTKKDTIHGLIGILEQAQSLLKAFINGLIVANKGPVSKRFNSEYNSAFGRFTP